MLESVWFRILCVGAAGALGAVARWGASHAAHAVLGRGWPIGTLLVNVLGCFVFGLAFEWFRLQIDDDALLRLVVLTGFAGAFTTFSTFAFDVYELAGERGLGWAALNIALHLVLGLAALLLGLAAARAV